MTIADLFSYSATGSRLLDSSYHGGYMVERDVAEVHRLLTLESHHPDMWHCMDIAFNYQYVRILEAQHRILDR